MKNFFKKLSFVLALAMVITSATPAVTASAANAPIVYKKGNSTNLDGKSVNIYVGGVKVNLDYNIGGKVSGVKGTWKSSNTGVVTVDKYGIVRAVKAGTATVTFTPTNGDPLSVTFKSWVRATDLDLYVSGSAAQVSYELAPGEGVDFNRKLTSKTAGQNSTYWTYYKLYKDAACTELADDSVATVNKAGVVSASAVGTVYLRAEAKQAKRNTEVKVPYVVYSDVIQIKVANMDPVAEQTDAKEITITAPDTLDKDKTTIEVKNGSIPVNIEKREFDGNKLVLTTETKLATAKYTLTMKTADGKEYTFELNGQSEKLDKIEIVGNEVVKMKDPKKGQVSFRTLNQFGKPITVSTLRASATGASNVDVDAGKGIITITFGSELALGTSVVVTIIDTSSTVSTNQTMVMGTQASVGNVEIVNATYNADKITLTEDVDLTKDKFYVLANMFDQYGNKLVPNDENLLEVNANNKLSTNLINMGTSFKSNIDTNTDFKWEVKTVDGKDYFALPLIPADSSKTVYSTTGTATLRLISVSTLKTTEAEIKVADGIKVDTFTISIPSAIYADEWNKVEYTAIDTYGKNVTDMVALNKLIKGKESNYRFKKNSSGTIILELNPGNVTYFSDAIITPTQRPVTVNTSVLAKAVPTAITGYENAVTGIISGESINVQVKDLRILDQYGRKMDPDNVAKAEGYGINIKVDSTSGSPIQAVYNADAPIDANGTLIFNNDLNKDTVLAKVSSTGVGSLNMTFALYDKATGKISTDYTKKVKYTSIDSDLTAVKNVSISAPDKLYNVGKDTTTAYQKDFTVYGVLEDGTKVKLKPNTHYSYYDNDPSGDLLVADTKIGLNTTHTFSDSNNAKETFTTTLTVVLTTGKTATKQITICEEKPVLTTFKYNTDLGAVSETAGEYTIKVNAASLPALTAKGFVDAFVKAEDQYGISAKTAYGSVNENAYYAASRTVGIITEVKNGGKIKNNGTADATVEGVTTNTTFTLELLVPGGQSIKATVEVN